MRPKTVDLYYSLVEIDFSIEKESFDWVLVRIFGIGVIHKLKKARTLTVEVTAIF